MQAKPTTPERTRRWPRPYRSTWVFVGFLAVVLALLNVPGQEVVEPVMASNAEFGGGSYFSTNSLLHHGWPMTAIQRDIIDYESPAVWDLTGDVVSVDISAIIVDAGVAISLIALGGFLFQTWRARRGSWRQFRLAELLFIVSLMAIGAKWIAAMRATARAERAALEAIDGSPDLEWLNYEVQPAGPTWLRRLLGDSLFADRDRVILIELPGNKIREALRLRRLQVIRIYGSVTTADLELLQEFPDLVALDLTDARSERSDDIGGADLPRAIPRLENLRGLNLYNITFRCQGIENLPRLEFLDLSRAYLDAVDECLEKIVGLRNLRILNVHKTGITRAGVARLAELPHLEELTLGSRVDYFAKSLISDAVVPGLSRMTQLRRLYLHDTEMTVEGLTTLRRALPNCEIVDRSLKGGPGWE